MLLAIDIGNTNIVFGIYKEKEWVNHWRIQTDQLKTADEYEVIFRSLLTAGKICRTEISRIILSSVVPSLVHPFREMLSGLFDNATINHLNPEIYDRLPIKILNPYEIGTDLVANATAAYQKYGNNTMVIDFGTALTFTTIGKNSAILGVAIAPGLRTAVGALAGKTAQLPQIHITRSAIGFGRKHHSCHPIGNYFRIHRIGRFDDRTYRKELGVSLNVVATGGLSVVIAPLTKNINACEPMLTLEGLIQINSFI